jgi:elongation factor 1 alpha-like protein
MSRRPAEFDDDDLDYDDGYDDAEEEELSPEDKASMEEATGEVRKLLGADFKKLSVKQVQDSLWHYYYDVDKTVAYLKKTYISPPAAKITPKKVPEGMSSKLSCLALRQNCPQGYGAVQECSAFYSNTETPVPPQSLPFTGSFQSFFYDMPWLNIPNDRQTVFEEPMRPPGGLLGGGDGTPKMSKLQALAAARKKKQEEKKENARPATPSIAENDMKRLSLSNQKSENEKPMVGLAKRQKTVDSRPSSRQGWPPGAIEQEIPSQDEPVQSMLVAVEDDRLNSPAPDEEEVFAPVPTEPSAFARTLFGAAPASSSSRRDVYAMPYTTSSSYTASAFTKPSPDDIVLTAQASGSNFAKTK